MSRYFFTSEAVCEGHPDKVCDQISDAILDKLLEQDPDARCACEVTVDPSQVHIMGEISTKAEIDYKEVAREVIRDIGYTDESLGFSDKTNITLSINRQSADIAMGVDKVNEEDQGAGDQGIMFGYACDETDCKMPLAIYLAHRLMEELTRLRKSGDLPYLRPDGKGQVTIEYVDGVPSRVDAVVISAQHSESTDLNTLRKDIEDKLIRKVIPAEYLDERSRFFINPTGRFVIGGPAGDTGLTGRKIICDTYGGYARHGGGAFSGKDASKVDRSAAYMTRYLAKAVVTAGLASKCEFQLSYAIGISDPTSVFVDCFGTEKVAVEKIAKFIQANFNLRPYAITKFLNLKKAQFRATSNNGHFGKENFGFAWENVLAEDIQKLRTLLD